MSWLLLTFLLGTAAGFNIGLVLALVMQRGQGADHLIILVVSRHVDDAEPGDTSRRAFLAARMLRHGIIQRSRN